MLELSKQINEDLRTARAIKQRAQENTRPARPDWDITQVPTKVYIVVCAEVYLLESGETFVDHLVSAVFLSRDAAEEYIDQMGPTGPDEYFIKEVPVRS